MVQNWWNIFDRKGNERRTISKRVTIRSLLSITLQPLYDSIKVFGLIFLRWIYTSPMSQFGVGMTRRASMDHIRQRSVSKTTFEVQLRPQLIVIQFTAMVMHPIQRYQLAVSI